MCLRTNEIRSFKIILDGLINIIPNKLHIYKIRDICFYTIVFSKKYTVIKDSQFSIDTINVYYIPFCYCNCRDRVYIKQLCHDDEGDITFITRGD